MGLVKEPATGANQPGLWPSHAQPGCTLFWARMMSVPRYHGRPYRSLRCVLQPETMMSVGCAAASSHPGVGGLHCHPRPWWCLSLCHCQGPRTWAWGLQPGSVLMSLVRITTRVHEDAGGLCSCQGLYWYEGPELPPKAMALSTGQASYEGLVRVYGPSGAEGHVHGVFCRQKPNGGPWSLLPQTIKLKDGCRCTVERERGGRLLWQFPPLLHAPFTHQRKQKQKQTNSLYWNLLKRSLKKCDRDVEE